MTLWLDGQGTQRCWRALRLVAFVAATVCLRASDGQAASPTVGGLEKGGGAPPTATVGLVILPSPTPTCSCSAACRCGAAEEPYGVGTLRSFPLRSAELESAGRRLEALSAGKAADFADAATLISCPEMDSTDGSWPPDASPLALTTPLPGGSWNLIELGVREAWAALGWPSVPLERRSVYIAMIDTGIDLSHPDLHDRVAPWRRSFAGPEPDADVSADSAHGTAMASIVVASGNNGAIGIDGIMWGAQVIACKIGGGSNGTLANALRCLEWLERLIDHDHVRIAAINFSFGAECCDCAMERALARLRDRGVLVVASAGNGRKDADSPGDCPFYPASYPLSNVIAVTGADPYGNVLFRYGKRRVHVAAPGVQIPVLTPAGGRSVMPGGSSPAAAHVTGVAALLYAQEPARSWIQVRNLLLSSGPGVRCGDQPTCALVTGRRLRAWGTGGLGALSCSGQSVVRRLLPVEEEIRSQPGQTVVLRVLSIECARPRVLPRAAIRQLSPAGGIVAELVFHDDGRSPDEVAGDGEFHAAWEVPTPPGRTYGVTVGGETLEIVVVPASGT